MKCVILAAALLLSDLTRAIFRKWINVCVLNAFSSGRSIADRRVVTLSRLYSVFSRTSAALERKLEEKMR